MPWSQASEVLQARASEECESFRKVRLEAEGKRSSKEPSEGYSLVLVVSSSKLLESDTIFRSKDLAKNLPEGLSKETILMEDSEK